MHIMHPSQAVDWSQAWLIEVNFTSILEWHHTHCYKKIHPPFYFPPFVYMTLTFGSANGIEYFALLQNTAIVQETYNTLILESFNRHKINIRVNECFRLIETFLTFCLNSCLGSDQLTWSEIFHTPYKKSSQISSHGLRNLKYSLINHSTTTFEY